jgi:UDP-glucose 4-epimerase
MADSVLVTGSSGFLGRHIVKRLREEGHDVEGVDIVEPDDASVPFTSADIRDFLAQTRADYDRVFHFAALVGGRATIDGSPLGIARNHHIDQSLFEFLADGRTTRVVYPSSSAVYPVERQAALGQPPLQEAEVDVIRGPLGVPDGTYGWTKLTAEFLAQSLGPAVQAATAIYRPFSVYGPGQSPDYPITAILRRALRREDPLVVWGSGDQHRDFVYIDDFLDVVMATHGSRGASAPLNIATGLASSFPTVARIAADLVGYRPKIAVAPGRPEGVLWRIGSPHQIPDAVLPRTTLEEGLSRTLEHLVTHV